MCWVIAEVDAARALRAGAPEGDAGIPDRQGLGVRTAGLADVDEASARVTAALVRVMGAPWT